MAEAAQVVREIAADGSSKQRVLIDLLNEPDRFGASWEEMRTQTPVLPILHMQQTAGCVTDVREPQELHARGLRCMRA